MVMRHNIGVGMAYQIQPSDIADYYTLSQIAAHIADLDSAISNARQSARDKFGDSQASQEVERQRLKDLMSEKAVYIKAYNLKAGNDSAYAIISPMDYNPSVPKI